MSLLCAINDTVPLDDVDVRWRITDGTYVNSSSTKWFQVSKYFHKNFGVNVTHLLIIPVSYLDNGVYTCEATTDISSGDWVSANVTLVLRGMLCY